MEGKSGAPLPETFADAVRWPIDPDAVRLSDKLVARLPAIAERVAPRVLAEPAGSRGRRDPEAAPDIAVLTDGFAAMRSAIESFYEVTAAADSRPVEIIDLGGPHVVARIEWTSEGAYSGLAMNRQMFSLYESSPRGRVSRQWLSLDLETAEAFYAERLAELSPGR